jgi:mono/diheme cytochrome c family protein
MLPAAMLRRSVRILLPVLALTALAGCSADFGEAGPDVAGTDAALRPGEQIFNERCGGCHTFEKAGTEGSAIKANSREIKDGPNFNVRKEQYDAVLYAIRNGGFSSGPMPQNIVVGHEAELVACFVATYSGTKSPTVPSPSSAGSSSGASDNTDCRKEIGAK